MKQHTTFNERKLLKALELLEGFARDNFKSYEESEVYINMIVNAVDTLKQEIKTT